LIFTCKNSKTLGSCSDLVEIEHVFLKFADIKNLIRSIQDFASDLIESWLSIYFLEQRG